MLSICVSQLSVQPRETPLMPEKQQPQRLLIQDKTRLADVECKHERVRQLLDSANAEALLLQEPASISWFTAGADLYRCASEDCSSSIFVTRDARLFATNSVDSSQIFEREAFGLGFQLKQREWYEPHKDLVADLCRHRRVLSDRGVNYTKPARRAIRNLRLPLTALETERLRVLARVAVHAVEASGHNIRAGVTEAEVAGEVSHRLLKRTVAATRIHVCADGRNERYRHWTFGEQPIEDYAAISCVARRWGLHVGVTRTVCLRSVPERLLTSFQKAAMVHATGLFFSRSGEKLGDVWKKVQRIYEKFGMGNEWQRADQASVVGYSAGESQVRPQSEYTIEAPTPVFWHPSVGPAVFGDTVLCQQDSNEQITLSASWPQVPVRVKGREVICPGILLLNDDSVEFDTAAESTRPDFQCPEHPDESQPDTVESIWEMRVPRDSDGWSDNRLSHQRPSVLDRQHTTE